MQRKNCVVCGVEFETKTRATRCEVHRTKEAKIKEKQLEIKESMAVKARGLGRKPKDRTMKSNEPRLPVVSGPLYFHRFDR